MTFIFDRSNSCDKGALQNHRYVSEVAKRRLAVVSRRRSDPGGNGIDSR